jgi:ketosteroid isomerase-like protein
MRKTFKLLFLFTALLLSFNLTAAQKNNNPDAKQSAQYEQTRKDLTQLLDDFKKIVEQKDINAIMALYDRNVISYDINPPLQYTGAAAYRKSWQSFLDGYDGPLEVEIRDLHMSASGNLAYTYCLERVTGTPKGGKRTDLWFRVSDVYQKKGGKWLIIHEHVSLPTDFATGKSVMDLKPSTK